MGVLGPLTVAVAVLALTVDAGAPTLSGGGSKRRDCLLQMQTDGVGFPGGASRFKGATCADGDVCDADGTRDGQCRFLTLWCVAQADATLPQCGPGEVEDVAVSGRVGKGKSGKLDPSEIDAAISGLGLPTSDAACSVPVPLDVPVLGPDGRGRFKEGTAKLKARARTSRGKDKDRYRLVCLPAVSVPPTSSSTTSTTLGGTTTTTSTTLPLTGTPGAGLQADFVGVVIDPDGTVHASFTLTDDAGVPLTPTASATGDPRQARVRITLARLEIDAESSEGVVTEFTRYVNYVTNASGQPTYDSSGGFMLTDAASGTWRYTFGTMLPAGFPAGLTHTVAAQVERATVEGGLVANPVFDFVPAGGPVTTSREASRWDAPRPRCRSRAPRYRGLSASGRRRRAGRQDDRSPPRVPCPPVAPSVRCARKQRRPPRF
jgi:hypothetical protein